MIYRYEVRTTEGNKQIINERTPLLAVIEYIERWDLVTNSYHHESDIIEVIGYGFYYAIYDPKTDSFEIIKQDLEEEKCSYKS